MDPPWFYHPDLQPGSIPLDEAEARHALGSHRLRPGDKLVLFDGQGRSAFGILQPDTTPSRSRKKHLHARVQVDYVQLEPPPARALTIIAAACKRNRLDWLIEKCTELGTTRLVFADFERSVVHKDQRHVEKLRRTAIEACKQCGRLHLPQLAVGTSLTGALQNTAPAALLVASLQPEASSFHDWLSDCNKQSVRIVIGPEGGFSPTDQQLLNEHAAQPIRLARNVLRIETAAVAAAAVWSATTR